MISERTLAESFSGFWAELLPLLTPSFVHMVSTGYRQPLVDRLNNTVGPVAKNPQTRDHAVVAEFAFSLAKIARSSGIGVDECFAQEILRTQAETGACKVVATYRSGQEGLLDSLNEAELSEGLALARNYQHFLEKRAGTMEVEFSPPIRGAGFIPACWGDLSIGNALFEVKTVERNIAGKDLRQLIIYLALQYATGRRRWDTAGFLNPRRAVSYEFGVDDLVTQMSGGKSTPEVVRELIDFVCTRDLQLDSPF